MTKIRKVDVLAILGVVVLIGLGVWLGTRLMGHRVEEAVAKADSAIEARDRAQDKVAIAGDKQADLESEVASATAALNAERTTVELLVDALEKETGASVSFDASGTVILTRPAGSVGPLVTPQKSAPKPVAPKPVVQASAEATGNTGWQTARASWYGPGLYGNTTANGNLYTPELVCVAHKTMAMGTLVEIRYNGRTITAPVLDRGPYVAGRTFDLSNAVAQALGFSGVQTIEWRLAPPRTH